MILKWITCQVPPQHKAEFSEAQTSWTVLKRQPGFITQFGGFDKSTARIAGIWDSLSDYDYFMRHVHDDIFGDNRQDLYYEKIETEIFEWIPDLSSIDFGVNQIVQDAAVLRLADCLVAEQKLHHFKEMQASVWNPGMALCDGMLGQMVWSQKQRTNRILIASFWRSRQALSDYRNGIFPDLRARARPDDDCNHIDGLELELEKKWTVSRNEA